MSDTMTAAFFVTRSPQSEGMRFVHSEHCQAFPDTQVDRLGTFAECRPAVAEARNRYDNVNACAMCCSACYEGSAAFEQTVS